jgi:hypothetical protein
MASYPKRIISSQQVAYQPQASIAPASSASYLDSFGESDNGGDQGRVNGPISYQPTYSHAPSYSNYAPYYGQQVAGHSMPISAPTYAQPIYVQQQVPQQVISAPIYSSVRARPSSSYGASVSNNNGVYHASISANDAVDDDGATSFDSGSSNTGSDSASTDQGASNDHGESNYNENQQQQEDIPPQQQQMEEQMPAATKGVPQQQHVEELPQQIEQQVKSPVKSGQPMQQVHQEPIRHPIKQVRQPQQVIYRPMPIKSQWSRSSVRRVVRRPFYSRLR